ncbi:hypothetical protein LguiA_002393 [Lonicera macranthoides]
MFTSFLETEWCSSYTAQRNQVKHTSLGSKEPSGIEKNDQKLNSVINNQICGLRLGVKQPSNMSLTRVRVTECAFIP